MNEKNILIVGANFDNKGAQSMLFVAVDEIKKRIPNAHIYFGSPNILDKNYAFDSIYYSGREKSITLGNHVIKNLLNSFLRDFIKLMLKRNNNFCKYKDLDRLLRRTDLIIDISGFSIGNKWPVTVQEEYLDNIRLAKKYNVPIILMPQSFGPFDYDEKDSHLFKEIGELFTYPKYIYAREVEGYKALVNVFGLSNVTLSTDLVLQNSGVDKKNIYSGLIEINLPKIRTRKNVGIVPNYQCFTHGDKNNILNLYKTTINELLELGYNIYIFRHSREDLEACRKIFEENKSERVYLIENDFTCFEFDEWIGNFDLVIASRYHSAVHSYRKYIPCVLYGWATKYKELARNVDEEKVYIDITSNVEDEKILNCLKTVTENIMLHKQRIESNMNRIQTVNCFESLEEFSL